MDDLKWPNAEMVNGVWVNESTERASVNMRCSVAPGFALFVAPAGYLAAVNDLLEVVAAIEPVVMQYDGQYYDGAPSQPETALVALTAAAARVRSLREGKNDE